MADLKQFLIAFCLFFAVCISTDAKKNKECEVECIRTENLQKHIPLNLEKIYVDVGNCQTVLTNSTSEGDCDLDIIAEEELCLKRCIPRSHQMVIVSERDGPREVPVIKGCYPTMHHCLPTCERRPNNIYFFPDSKYQTKVDIGKCVGGCNGTNSMCMSERNRTVAVEGPNGVKAVDVIESCKCVNPGCYRTDYFMSFWNYYDNTTQREEKEVNVGMCVGTCPGVFLDDLCLPSPDNCVLRIPGGPATCSPTRLSGETYTDENNQEKTVTTITECGCASG